MHQALLKVLGWDWGKTDPSWPLPSRSSQSNSDIGNTEREKAGELKMRIPQCGMNMQPGYADNTFKLLLQLFLPTCMS